MTVSWREKTQDSFENIQLGRSFGDVVEIPERSVRPGR